MNPPVRPSLPRRLTFLFLIATLIPCVVLLALGLQLLGQERQLGIQRRLERRQFAVEQAEKDLLSQLERIKLQELAGAATAGTTGRGASTRRAPVVFVGTLVDGRLRLPWEGQLEAEAFRKALEEPDFARELRLAETAELVARDYVNAVGHYRAALVAARQAAQRTYAQLLLARALARAGWRDESRRAYEAVVLSPETLVDEHGVPLALYAAPPLLEAGLRVTDIREQVHRVINADRWPAPAALYLIRDLARRLDDRDLMARSDALLRETERAEVLQRDSARLLASVNSREPIWIPYGDPTWLASVTAPDKGHQMVVVVRAGEVLASVTSNIPGQAMGLGTETTGQLLGDSFPGLRVVLPPERPEEGSARLTFLAFALVLALSATILAGYLLRRDVQRDLRLAEMRSQFVSSVTHELKTPLTAIRMFTETLQLDEDVDPRTRSEYLDTILHESERLSRLVDNVLDFGKIERGKKIYRFEPVRLDEVVEGAARALQYPLEQAGFALDVAVERSLPPVRADADALQQAIQNLLTNAMKYSGDSRRINLSLNRLNGDARIQVIDEGVGIAPVDQSRVFERFFRAPTAENRHIPGAGLGLTLVAHIASAHGGAVDIDSTPGHGSTFTIRLPLRSGDLDAATDARRPL